MKYGIWVTKSSTEAEWYGIAPSSDIEVWTFRDLAEAHAKFLNTMTDIFSERKNWTYEVREYEPNSPSN